MRHAEGLVVATLTQAIASFGAPHGAARHGDGSWRFMADDEAECQLLCDADEACARVRFSPISKTCSLEWDDAVDRDSPRGDSKPRVLLVTYAAGERFEETQRRLDQSLAVAEIDAHWMWKRSSFDGDGVHAAWFRTHNDTNFRRGGAWKPYVIWQAFRRLRWGDWLIYHDASQYFQDGFSSSVRPLLAWLEANKEQNPCRCIAAVRLRQSMQHEWEQQCIPEYGAPRSKRDAFRVFCGLMWRLGACVPSSAPDCCEQIWQKPTMQHSWSVWHKSPSSAHFLRDWARFAADYESVAHLPFIDQSLNTLLVHTWHRKLGIRPLWVPSLYRMAWDQDMDTGSYGRNSGDIFKHLNFVLDALYNQQALGQRHLWLTSVDDSGVTDGVTLGWSEATTTREAWSRSLCISQGGATSPVLSMQVLAVQLYLTVDGVREPWGGLLKRPSGWEHTVYRPHRGGGTLPRVWRAALRAPPRATESRLPVSLGSWDMALLHDRGEPVEVLAHLYLRNEGLNAWPPGAYLCAAPEWNLTETQSRFEGVSIECGPDGGPFRNACGALEPWADTNLFVTFRRPFWQRKGQLAVGSAWWALCDPRTGQPFGTPIEAVLRPR